MKFSSRPTFQLGKDVECCVTFFPLKTFCSVGINKKYGDNRSSVGNVLFIVVLLCVCVCVLIPSNCTQPDFWC